MTAAKKPDTPVDLFSRDQDGNQVDAWIFDELLGDDDQPDAYHHDISKPPFLLADPETRTFRDKIQLTSEGAYKAWETRSRGGAEPATKAGGTQMREATGKDAARIKALKLPPAWTDIRLATDPTAALQATGVDTKGRTQFRYSAEHTAEAKAEKFARMKDFHGALPDIRDKIDEVLNDPDSDPETRDAALVTALIDKTTFRVGSTRDTLADVKAYGATTLQAKHVKINGDTLTFKFVGKKGVTITKTITDRQLASALKPRLATRGPLFPETSDADVRRFMTNAAPNFSPKDFRTYHATRVALEEISKVKAGLASEKPFKAQQKTIATTVSKVLGNNPSEALKSYIDPAVWDRLRSTSS